MADGIFTRGLRVAGLALKARRLAQLDEDSERQIARRALANQFADARGTIMKIGQLLSAHGDEFQPLIKGIPPVPLADMQAHIEQILNRPLSSVFRLFDEASVAASLGQVHHAVLTNGREVAVKVQYPDIRAHVEAEISLIGLMPGLGPVRKWGFDLEAYKQVFKNNMDRELDYLAEARMQQSYQQQVIIDGLVIPQVHAEFSSAQLMVQDWEQGQYLDEITDWPAADRKKVAGILLGTLFKSLFEAGVVHGDPHLGNSYYRYNDQHRPEVVLMDFGCTIHLSRVQRLSLLKLILATIDGTDVPILRYFASLGFDADKLHHIGNRLPMLCRILFEPFLQNRVFPLQQWQLESAVSSLLEEQRWWFRSAGPAELFLIMRAFQGVVQQLEILGINVSWQQLLFQHVSDDIIQQARQLSLPAVAAEQSIATSSIQALARSLCVRVSENGRQKVEVTLPAETVLELDSLIPVEVLAILESSPDIDLNLIQQRIRESGIAPQTVFELTNGSKDYRVWLE